jgi:hypothetical protein
VEREGASDQRPAAEYESSAWHRWNPVLAGSMVAHVVGGAGLLVWNRGRERHQRGVTASTAVKSALTVAAVGLTLGAVSDGLRSEQLRRRVEAGDVSRGTREARERVERRMKVIGPLIPATTGALVVLGALEGEQQRPREMAKGLISGALHRVSGEKSVAAAFDRVVQDGAAVVDKVARDGAAVIDKVSRDGLVSSARDLLPSAA